MLVVSDSGPIISLLKISRLELLRDAYEQVLIPPAIFKELTGNARFSEEAKIIRECSFVRIQALDNESEAAVFGKGTGLDIGESEAILLANQLSAELLLIDELKGRAVAKNMGLAITGTIGVLLDAYERGFLSADEISACIEVLRENKRHISEALYKELIDTVKPTSTDKVANEDE